MTDLDDRLWQIVTAPSDRGMAEVRDAVRIDLFTAAAKALLSADAPVLIGTGFPISGPPETDGPPGAFALLDALCRLGKNARIASWQDANAIFAQVRPDIEFVRIERQPDLSEIEKLDGVSFVAIEVCGLTEDGTYRDMHHRDISHLAPNFEDYLGTGALVAIGDGGNEYGMGGLPPAFFEKWDVIPPVSRADHLLPAMVSNFGAYALVKALEIESGTAELLPDPQDHLRMIEALVDAGCVNGMSGQREYKVDGHDLARTGAVLEALAKEPDF